MAKTITIPDSTDLLPDPQVARQRYKVDPRTLYRWDKRPGLNFPKAIVINRRKYRRIHELEAWERQQVAADSECAPYSQKPELKVAGTENGQD